LTRAQTRRARRGLRLAPDVRPEAYEVFVALDPARGRRFRGEVAIALQLDRPRREIELHAAGLALSKPRLERDGGARRGEIGLRPERETAVVRFAEPVPAGRATLRLAFAGTLARNLRGLYAAASGPRRYAFTQLEATEARRFFPCFDEPAMKARFRISVETAVKHSLVSNAPIEKEEPRPGGRKLVRFEPTPPLSTYLVALAVGELEASEPARCGETEIRVWHVPGKGHLTAFALEAARETLARLEHYFGLPYPYGKLDLVAVPDFEAGAMENAGAVFFRETLLLLDPATATLGERKRAAEVICHELAHMWYGDLVTMAWWDDLWLNEAFATWMAFQVVDAWKPEWHMWRDFQHFRAAALDLDALSSTHPIYTEVRSPEEATANFDLVTYEKGASVVRMLERYLGSTAFRNGVRRYIRRHREANAVADDLWRALSEASGQDVAPIARAWIERPGFPLVALRRDGAALELRQERFALRPRPRRGARELWPVPWVGRAGRQLVRHLLVRAREPVALPAGPVAFVYGNADEGGFFRPLHDAAELRALRGSLGALSAVERMGLVGHPWAAVRAGRAEIDAWLELASGFGTEADPDVLVELRGPLAFIDDQIARAAGPESVSRFRDFVVRVFGEQLLELGWDAAPGEDEDTRLRRAAIIGILGELGWFEPVLESVERRFPLWLADRSTLDPNLADPLVVLAARAADATRYDALLAAMRTAKTPQERRRFLLGLGSVSEPRLVERSLRLSLTPVVPTQDVAFLLVRLLQNPAARDRTWDFLRRSWRMLARRLPPMLATRVIEATPVLQTRSHKQQVAAHFRRHRVPAGERALRQALERFDLNAALRRRAAPVLRRFLAGLA
jgi:puromycin-sensitive aminopeptidase